MLRIGHVIKPWRESGALNAHKEAYSHFDDGDPDDRKRWYAWLRKLKLNSFEAEKLMQRAAVNFRVPDAVAARKAVRLSAKHGALA